MGLIIGFFGYAQSGKDSSVNITKQLLEEEIHIEVTCCKFADKLKKCAGIILGVDPTLFENNYFKSQKIGADWGDMTYREFLQILGTEAAQKLSKNIWVNSLFNKVTIEDNILISDMRFPHEVEEIKKRGGFTVKIQRPGVSAVNNHISENALDDYIFDFTIDNNGSIEELKEKLFKVIVEILAI